MSFHCKACGRQRAGSPAEGQEVCDECRPTQAGRACLLLAHFECRFDADQILALDNILGEAQNGPPDGAADKSFTVRRWIAIRDLIDVARKFNKALDNVHLATEEQRP